MNSNADPRLTDLPPAPYQGDGDAPPVRDLQAALDEYARLYRLAQGEIAERRRAEEELRRRERELADFFENGAVGLHWVGPDGTILRANRAELEMLGYAAEEYVGHHVAEFHADEEVIGDILRRLKAGQTLHDCEARLRCKDGSLKHVLINSNVLWEGGRFVHTRCFTRDVSARRRAEQALRDGEERHRRLADNLPSGFIYQIAQGPGGARHFTYVSGGVEALCGVSPTEVAADPTCLYGLIVEEDRERVRATEDAALREGGRFDCQFRVRGRGGQVRWLHCRSAPRRQCEGAPVWDGIAIDVTEQRRAEEELAASREQLEVILRGVADGITVQEPGGRLLFANDGAARLTGCASAEALLRMPLPELMRRFEIYDESGRPLPPTELPGRRALSGEESPEAVVRFRVVATGEERWSIVRATAVRDARGALRFAVNIFHDITERKRAEEALREADRRKDEFLAMLAHELRNPLAPVRNALHLLRQPNAPPEVQARAREMAERQVVHMARLVDDLLEVSRVTRGKITLKKGPADLAAVVTRAAEATMPAVHARRHELKLSLPRSPVPLTADPARLEQVLVNLLTNAAKYTPPGGTIWLSADGDGRSAVVRVKDTGVGIAPALLPRVFDLFVQAEQGPDRQQGGLGIGLTLVKSLVEMHGGTVEAHSDGPGRGSEFVVRLPAAAPAPADADGAAAPAGPAARPRRVLVVDDNHDAADSMALLLGLKGHEVRTAHDGAAALAAAAAFRPEVVLLDIGLPGMDGCEVARRLRATEDGVRPLLVAVTGYGQEEDRRRSAEAGFDHHLVKPPDPDAVERLLAERGQPAR